MFSIERRRQVSDRLLQRARADERVIGAARTGSAARGVQDSWSDIDLFFGITEDALGDVLADWSSWVYPDLGAVHHFDLRAGSTTYRAFLLADGLEIDLGFAPASAFGPVGDGAFDVVFGDPVERKDSQPDADHLIGLCWHHAAHARVAIARQEPWHAEYWISALRNHTISLACLRHGLPSHYAKGAGQLPTAELDALAAAVVARLDEEELIRALAAAVATFLAELNHTNPAAAGRLQPVLRQLTDSVN
ncbi:MAG: nucleotidyltransferase domain-containing protein [Actinomycetota bacterium]|nr:nucleotidyltransferase domain-containing protein [Actinomycetota bacterium]